jgi:hypothetical protein
MTEVCGEELEGYMSTLKTPRIIVSNVPEGVTSEKAAQTTALQKVRLKFE